MKQNKGLFIVLEGLDGAGTSSQVQILYEKLLSQGKAVIKTKEPTDGPIGRFIKKILREEYKTSPLALQLLFCADRAEHLEREILPALTQNKIVISDRYFQSTLAYGALDLPLDILKDLNRHFHKPDLTIFLDVSVETCLQRIKESRKKLEIFEEERKLSKIAQNYKKIISDPYFGMKRIDGEKSLNAVAEDVYNLLTAYF